MKSRLPLAIFILVLFILPCVTHAAQDASLSKNGSYERASIEGVGSRGEKTSTGGQQVNVFHVRFLSGPLKNQTRDITNEIESNPYGLNFGVGDTAVIFIQTDSDGTQHFYLDGFDRRSAILWLIVLFILMMILLAGWQGFKVVLSIAISLALIGLALIPLFLKGFDPIPIALVLVAIFACVSTILSTGWNKKSMVTIIGTVGGTITAYLLSVVFANWAHLNGLSSEDDRLFFNQNPTLNPRGLLFAGIMIASVGIVEDVAVSISSGVAEVKRANPRAGVNELFRSGMTIGNDHMGALANTLIFAYAGGSLSSLLLYHQYGGSWLKFINFDTVVDEVIRSLCGTIGLIFTVPITALLAAWVMSRVSAKELEQLPHDHAHVI